MWWRHGRAAFEKHKGTGNKRAIRRIIASRGPIGVLAYSVRKPLGWCAVASRDVYNRLASSRATVAIWSSLIVHTLGQLQSRKSELTNSRLPSAFRRNYGRHAAL